MAPSRVHRTLEICCDNIESVHEAIIGGADRIELCSALTEGGLTPSYGLAVITKHVCDMACTDTPVYAMIRLRGGSFNYKKEEVDAMVMDVENLKPTVDGFVFGALTTDKKIDSEACRKIIQAAKPKRVTFHRAFDEVADLMSALRDVRDLGFERILTSGLAPSAREGIGNLRTMVQLTKDTDELSIMCGKGITEDNIGFIMEKSRATEFHGSAKTESPNRPYPTLTCSTKVAQMRAILMKRPED